MSRVAYTPGSFHVDRKSGSSWISVPGANFTYTEDYDVHDNTEGIPSSKISTLVINQQTATITMTRYGELTGERFYVGDQMRAMLGSKVLFLGTVETVQLTRVVDPAMHVHGKSVRTDITYTCGGYYADLMSHVVSWGVEEVSGVVLNHGPGLPQEPWLTRIKRFVTVTNE